MDDPGLARVLWTHFEPVHAVTYFHPRARAAYEAVGLRGYWRGYFAGRAAPLGPTGAPPVIAAFFSFAPRMVARALPSVWRLATPEEALRARLTGAVQALAEFTYELPEAHLVEAAELLEAAAGRVETAGRVLGAVNAALPAGEYPLARLWQAATTLREHRGDGHVAALVTTGLDPVEVLAWRCRVDQSREFHQPARGWTDEEWAAAEERLVDKGWLTVDREPTAYGSDTFRAVEEATDRAAVGPWRALGAERTERLRELLEPIARRCRTIIPRQSPIGLPATRRS
ncbi:SCO6745 family protein [Micromonospora sp. NBC_00898]|uniref:SCO6745 family protein n=1 Tax=Micromonospora sp. NBC_00898 TaxID=2975981 RepID=UPI0038678DAE